jgi:hypothetical protein
MKYDKKKVDRSAAAEGNKASRIATKAKVPSPLAPASLMMEYEAATAENPLQHVDRDHAPEKAAGI